MTFSRCHKSQYISGEVEEDLVKYFADTFAPKFADFRSETCKERKLIMWMLMTCVRGLRDDGGEDLVPKYFYQKMSNVFRDANYK